MIKKIFAKAMREFLGYTEYVFATTFPNLFRETPLDLMLMLNDRQKLNERIRLGSQPDVMDGILNNKDGMVCPSLQLQPAEC